MNIGRNDLVLEIGPGNFPRERSNVLCERYPFDGYHRESRRAVMDSRPYVVADGTALPFADKAFDYVICSHVIEHTTDPAKFIQEICRVGQAGYIETPSDIKEDMFGWPFHEFKLRLENSRLVLIKKHHHDPLFADLFHRIYRCDPCFARWVRSRRELFLTALEWREEIDYEIITDPSDPRSSRSAEYIDEIVRYTEESARRVGISDPVNRRWTLPRIAKALRRRFDRLVYGSRALSRRFPPSRLIEILVCPACKSKVRETASGYACTDCGRDYPWINGLPTFLIEDQDLGHVSCNHHSEEA